MITSTSRLLVFGVVLGFLVSPLRASAEEAAPPEVQFKDEPEAHGLYDQMVETMRKAESLSYESDYRWESSRSGELGHCTYTVWLKKPNYFRLEAARDDQVRGILVGDGERLWIHWPNGRPQWGWEYEGERAKEYERTRLISYMTQQTPVGRHSIGHQTSRLGAGMSMTIIDPSTFHGYTDSLQAYLDGVRSLGTERIGDEDCEGIEVSFMKHQRSWYLWLSKRDHLPRKLREVVRVSYDIITHEHWSNVTINGEIPDEKFAWKPPADWVEFRFPAIEEGLLKAGTEAPDFELASVDESQVRLSDFRGKVVWFYLWRAG